MPSSDYTSAVGGGLKLKGAKDAAVKKRKKKDKDREKVKAIDGGENEKVDDLDATVAKRTEYGESPDGGEQNSVQKALADEDRDGVEGVREQDVKDYGKTEAQRRFDERRRKRLDERLKRDGIKTHKQRVEELNKYLSGLSEHHDMPRIGPG